MAREITQKSKKTAATEVGCNVLMSAHFDRIRVKPITTTNLATKCKKPATKYEILVQTNRDRDTQ